MFTFTNKATPSTILITSHSALTGDQLTVGDQWQQRHAPNNLAHVLGQAITETSSPLENALTHYLKSHALPTVSRQPLHEFHFEQESGISGTIWHHGSEYQLAVKGTPERILEVCDVSENERESIVMQLHAMSATGASVIALATGIIRHPVKKVADIKKQGTLSFVGLVSLNLNITGAARRYITSAKEKGIAVYLASGIHPVTAYHIGNQLGIATKPSDVYNARHLDETDMAGLSSLVSTTNIFARMNDQQKHALLMTLQAIDKTTVGIETLEDFKKLLAN
jgi:Ca2+-transporting ATPase